NKIDGIDSAGKIIYRQVCTNFRTRTTREKIDPIDVPAEEAAGLRPGDFVNAWVTSAGRRGAISNAQREDKLVQVRGHRLRVKETRGERRESASCASSISTSVSFAPSITSSVPAELSTARPWIELTPKRERSSSGRAALVARSKRESLAR